MQALPSRREHSAGPRGCSFWHVQRHPDDEHSTEHTPLRTRCCIHRRAFLDACACTRSDRPSEICPDVHTDARTVKPIQPSARTGRWALRCAPKARPARSRYLTLPGACVLTGPGCARMPTELYPRPGAQAGSRNVAREGALSLQGSGAGSVSLLASSRPGSRATDLCKGERQVRND